MYNVLQCIQHNKSPAFPAFTPYTQTAYKATVRSPNTSWSVYKDEACLYAGVMYVLMNVGVHEAIPH